MAGLYFEEFEDGMVIEHAIRRTITESDNTLFSVMTMNPAALHLDHHYAETETEFGKPLVNSLLTLSTASRRSKGTDSTSSRPASIFEKSRMSFRISRSAVADE